MTDQLFAALIISGVGFAFAAAAILAAFVRPRPAAHRPGQIEDCPACPGNTPKEPTP